MTHHIEINEAVQDWIDRLGDRVTEDDRDELLSVIHAWHREQESGPPGGWLVDLPADHPDLPGWQIHFRRVTDDIGWEAAVRPDAWSTWSPPVRAEAAP